MKNDRIYRFANAYHYIKCRLNQMEGDKTNKRYLHFHLFPTHFCSMIPDLAGWELSYRFFPQKAMHNHRHVIIYY